MSNPSALKSIDDLEVHLDYTRSLIDAIVTLHFLGNESLFWNEEIDRLTVPHEGLDHVRDLCRNYGNIANLVNIALDRTDEALEAVRALAIPCGQRTEVSDHA